MVSRGHHRDFAAGLEAPQSGGDRTHAPAHFLGHSAEHLRRFDATRDQRGNPPHRRLLGDEPAILGVQRDIVERLVELPDQEVRRRLAVRPWLPRKPILG